MEPGRTEPTERYYAGFSGLIHGVNPAFLIEKILRERILESLYWKDQCFGLTAATICDRAAELECIGGWHGNLQPTDYICLVFKLLQLRPSTEIIKEYLAAEDFKYLRALAAFYVRLTFRSVDVYVLLEPLLADYRKLRVSNAAGYVLTYMDQFVDDLLHNGRVCDVALPQLRNRLALEETDDLEPRDSALGSELESDGEDATTVASAHNAA